MSLFERVQNKILIEQPTDEQERTSSRKSKGGGAYSGGGNQRVNQNEKKTKYQRLRDQRTKYNVLKNKEGVYKPSIASAKAKIGERLKNITQPPDPKATQKNALNATPARIKKLNKAQRRAARFEPGAGVKDGKDYRTRILDRITKNQEANIDTSKKGRINRMRAGISATSPTIQGTDKRPARFVNGKQYGGGRLPKPGGPNEVDFSTGGKGVNQKGIRTDQAVKNRLSASRDSDLGKVSKNELNKARRQQAAYDKQVRANQAKLKTPGGAKYYTGKKTPLNKPVLNRSDFNLQKVYDDLSSETAGKNARKRPKNAKSYAQIKAEIGKKYPVKMSKTGLIPDKSTGAYSSANATLKKPRVIKKTLKPPVKELEKIKPKVKGNLFDPTGKIADETKKVNQSFKDFIRKLKTKHPKPKLSLYDPLKTKINVEPLKPLRTFIKPSITQTATKSKGLIPKLLKAASKNPKAALGVGLLTLGTYGMVKNRKKAPVKNKNKSLVIPPTKKDEIITRPVSKTFKLVGDKSRKPIPPKKM